MPAVVDLAAMRDAMNKLGSDPNRINPLVNENYLVLSIFSLKGFVNFSVDFHPLDYHAGNSFLRRSKAATETQIG